MNSKAADLPKVKLAPGRTVTLKPEDVGGGDPWRTLARNHGMSPENLQAFNPHLTGIGATGVAGPQPLAAGATLYIPSAQELGFAECRRKAGSYDAAIALWGKMVAGPNVKVLDAARARASGEVGQGYGTQGVEGGRFYTQNPTLAGASAKRSKTINGKTEYRVFWLAEFWKCSLFMHDVVWQAGYQPHQTANNHYQLAGRLNESKQQYAEVSAKDAMPGDCWQRFGGRGSDESHNTILSSFVEVEEVDAETERWTFDIIGAEQERAAEATQTFVVKKGTQEVVSGAKTGNLLRFFRPRVKRT
jgi:hypothetical protein